MITSRVSFLSLLLCAAGHAGTVVSEEPGIARPAPANGEWWSRALLYTWITAIEGDVGLRGRSRITEKIALCYNGDIGGFGVESDLNWQVFAGFAYDLRANSSVGFGYRAMGIDYSKDSFTMDTVTHGPVHGFELRW